MTDNLLVYPSLQREIQARIVNSNITEIQ